MSFLETKENNWEAWNCLRAICYGHPRLETMQQAGGFLGKLQWEGVHPRLMEAIWAVYFENERAMVWWFEKWEPKLAGMAVHSTQLWWVTLAWACAPSYVSFLSETVCEEAVKNG